MKKSGSKCLYKELRDWRQNKTETWKLSETHDQFDKQLASRRKSHDKEVWQLSKELRVKATKATPSVDEHLGKSHRRNENVKAAERARLDRRYNVICNANMRNFRQLKLSGPSNMPPEIVERIVAKRGSRSAGKRTALTDHAAPVTETTGEDDKRKYGEEDTDTKDNDIDTDKDKDRGKRGPNEDDAEGNSDEDDESGDVEEPPEWYVGRRRFTLAALNEVPDHIAEARRQSAVATLNLAAILEVASTRRSWLDKEKKAVHEVDKSLDSEKEDAEEESAADDSDTEKAATDDGSDNERGDTNP